MCSLCFILIIKLININDKCQRNKNIANSAHNFLNTYVILFCMIFYIIFNIKYWKIEKKQKDLII